MVLEAAKVQHVAASLHHRRSSVTLSLVPSFFPCLLQAKSTSARMRELQKWHKDGGLMLMGYEMFRLLVCHNPKPQGGVTLPLPRP